MKSKRILMFVLALVMLAMPLAGCSSSGGWSYVKEKGVLIVGLDDTFAPMGYRDESGTLVGFDIDLANAVGEVLGVTIQFQPIDWTAKELELTSKRIDCIWNGMSATAERQESMALTNKYLNNQIVLMSIRTDLSIKSEADLVGLKIGTQADSAALETMQDNAAYDTFKANISEYPTYDEAILDMQAGRVDVIAVDKVLADYKNTKLEVKMTQAEFDFGDDFFAIGCRKAETDLADKLTEAIQTLIDNGKAAEISNKWFGENRVICEGYDK